MPNGPLPVLARPGPPRSVRAGLIGLGVVVSAGLSAAPALAAPLAGGDVRSAVPDFTVSGTVHVRLAAAPAPADLDLSGARFDVLDNAGAIAGSCDTDKTGACDIPAPGPPGAPAIYRLVQDAGRPVPGLVPSSDVSTFVVCSPDATYCPNAPIPVTDASSFRTKLVLTVLDGGTRMPLAGAEYSLTGPDYRHHPAVPQEAETTVFPDSALTGSDGRLTFSGWFLPGDWSVTPEVIPHGYRSSGVLPMTVPAPTADGADVWSTVVGLAADVPDGTGTGRPPVPPVVFPAPPGGPTSSAPAPVVAPPPTVASPVGASLPPAPSPSPVLPSPVPPAAVAPSAQPSAADPTVPPPAAERARAAGRRLRVSSATSSLEVGLVGFVAVLVTLVAFGVGYVRRRARH